MLSNVQPKYALLLMQIKLYGVFFIIFVIYKLISPLM